MDKGQGTCLRANNLYSYMELNRNVDRILPSIAPNVDHKVHPSSKIHEKSQVKINVTILSARHFKFNDDFKLFNKSIFTVRS